MQVRPSFLGEMNTMTNLDNEISIDDFKSKKDKVVLIDVRDLAENQQFNIGGKLIPLDTLSARLNELEAIKEKEIVLYCRSGRRSLQAVGILKTAGFNHVKSLKGGMNAWLEEEKKLESTPKMDRPF